MDQGMGQGLTCQGAGRNDYRSRNKVQAEGQDESILLMCFNRQQTYDTWVNLFRSKWANNWIYANFWPFWTVFGHNFLPNAMIGLIFSWLTLSCQYASIHTKHDPLEGIHLGQKIIFVKNGQKWPKMAQNGQIFY